MQLLWRKIVTGIVSDISESQFITSREIKDHFSVNKEWIFNIISDMMGFKQDLDLSPALAFTLDPCQDNA